MELVHVVMHQFRSLQYRSLREGALDLTHMESKVVGYFSRHPGATLSDLAAHSGRDKAQLAKLVKALRERELLEAQPDAADRRSVRLRPSAAGQDVQKRLQAEARELSGHSMHGLDGAEQAQLLALLQRVRANLDTLE